MSNEGKSGSNWHDSPVVRKIVCNGRFCWEVFLDGICFKQDMLWNEQWSVFYLHCSMSTTQSHQKQLSLENCYHDDSMYILAINNFSDYGLLNNFVSIGKFGISSTIGSK